MLFSVVIFTCLVMSTAMRPIKSHLSVSELKRRSKKTEVAALELRRHTAYVTLETLLRTLRAVLLVLLVSVLIGALGWGWGVVLAIIVAVIHPTVARFGPIRRASQSLYVRIEPQLLEFVARYAKVLSAMREPSGTAVEPIRKFHSREDLAELISHSEDIIGRSERVLLSSAMEFFNKQISEVMTPRSVIDFIKKSEFLGPLVLDELHTLGHSRLPVIAEDLNHVVGVLHQIGRASCRERVF